MTRIYAIEIKKTDLPLITMLNDGVVPDTTKKDRWFIFEVDEEGKNITTIVMTKREMYNAYDFVAINPFIVGLKKAK